MVNQKTLVFKQGEWKSKFKKTNTLILNSLLKKRHLLFILMHIISCSFIILLSLFFTHIQPSAWKFQQIRTLLTQLFIYSLLRHRGLFNHLSWFHFWHICNKNTRGLRPVIAVLFTTINIFMRQKKVREIFIWFGLIFFFGFHLSLNGQKEDQVESENLILMLFFSWFG